MPAGPPLQMAEPLHICVGIRLSCAPFTVTTPVRSLIASPIAGQRETLLDWLAPPTYESVAVKDFHEAKSYIDSRCPELLTTDLKLGAHNGLQLVMRGKLRNRAMCAIVLGDPDPVLERDAAREGAVYLKGPLVRAEFQDAVTKATDTLRGPRRSPRTTIPPLPASFGLMDARVHNVSYEGLLLELPDSGTIPPESFALKIPDLNILLSLRRAWATRASAGDAIWCGAALATVDGHASAMWRILVDRASGQPAEVVRRRG